MNKMCNITGSIKRKVSLDIKNEMKLNRIKIHELADISGVAERTIVTIRQGKPVTVFIASCVSSAMSKLMEGNCETIQTRNTRVRRNY